VVVGGGGGFGGGGGGPLWRQAGEAEARGGLRELACVVVLVTLRLCQSAYLDMCCVSV
jgi:hypothetical protein